MKIVKLEKFQDVIMCKLGFSYIGQPLMCAYFYILGDIVIDSGQSHLKNEVLSLLTDRKISMVLLTHHHEDHSGNVAEIKEKFQVPAYLHHLGIKKLQKGFKILFYQHWVWGRASKVQCEPVPEKIESSNYTLTCIHTPGHSKDHVVYYLPDKGYLFSGDLYLGDRIKYFRVDERICDQIESLKKVSKLDFDVLFCGHRPRTKNGKKHILSKLDYLENLYGEISHLLKAGRNSKDIMKRVCLKEVLSIKIFTQKNVSAENIVRSVAKCEGLLT